MTTEYKLNQLIEWTAEDRAKGKCPVPDGSEVTVWFDDGSAERDCEPEEWNWRVGCNQITAYLIHSVLREPLVAWGIVGGPAHGDVDTCKDYIEQIAKHHGGRVVKMVEVME
jgi:hypothetical protein